MLANLHVGYGIHAQNTPALETAIEEQIDLEFILADHFPLLAMGTYGNSYEVDDLVLIKSSLMEADGYFLDLPEQKQGIRDDEMAELQRFCTEYDIECKSGWIAFMTAFA